MSDQNFSTFDEVFAPFEQDPEYQKEKRKLKPYYDLVTQIIQLRAHLNLTQKDLAARANTFQSRISKIESAEHDIRLSTLIQIAEALDAEVSIHLIPLRPEQASVHALFSGVEGYGGISYAEDTASSVSQVSEVVFNVQPCT